MFRRVTLVGASAPNVKLAAETFHVHTLSNFKNFD